MYLNVQNGVKQGNVLSPILYNVYIDELILRLKKNSTFGCRINSLYVGALSYADDLTLISPKVQGLQNITVFGQFGKEYGVQLNESKSKTMIFGEHLLLTRYITVLGKKLEWVNHALTFRKYNII